MASYEIQLTDDTGTATLAPTEVPLTVTPLEGAVDVTTLSYNVYTDFIALKRAWTHTWDFMTESDYNTLLGYYTRQFSSHSYPELTIDDESVNGVTVRMSMQPKNIIDGCGTVADVTVSFRETRQLGS